MESHGTPRDAAPGGWRLAVGEAAVLLRAGLRPWWRLSSQCCSKLGELVR
jgi:hypothetical protein